MTCALTHETYQAPKHSIVYTLKRFSGCRITGLGIPPAGIMAVFYPEHGDTACNMWILSILALCLRDWLKSNKRDINLAFPIHFLCLEPAFVSFWKQRDIKLHKNNGHGFKHERRNEKIKQYFLSFEIGKELFLVYLITHKIL